MKLILDTPRENNNLVHNPKTLNGTGVFGDTPIPAWEALPPGPLRPTTSLATPAPTEKKQAQKQILMLDGVRAIACLLVLSYHMSILIRDYAILPPLLNINPPAILLSAVGAFFAAFGESGVILFFVLSSFLLFLPYAKALLLEEASWPGVRRYYLRRIFRILPSYYITLLLVISFFHPEFLNFNHWPDLLAFLTLTMNLDLSSHVNIPFWTLAIEFQFYLLLPLIAWLLRRVVGGGRPDQRLRKLVMYLLILASWGVVTRYVGLTVATTGPTASSLPYSVWKALQPYIYGDTGRYFDIFSIGMLLATMYTYIQSTPTGAHWRTTMRQISPFVLAVGVALLVLLPLENMETLNYGGYIPTSSFSDPHIALLVRDWMQWQVIGYGLAYSLCLWALLFGTIKLKRHFEGTLLRQAASISFSLYMWHLPFMYLFIYAIVDNIHTQAWHPVAQYGLFWCWVLVVILPVCVSFYRWVEQPGVRLGERVIVATQGWWRRYLVAHVHPISVPSEVITETPADWRQFKGHVLAKKMQWTASHTIPEALSDAAGQIITPVPSVLPRAFTLKARQVLVPPAVSRGYDLRSLS